MLAPRAKFRFKSCMQGNGAINIVHIHETIQCETNVRKNPE